MMTNGFSFCVWGVFEGIFIFVSLMHGWPPVSVVMVVCPGAARRGGVLCMQACLDYSH